jgi:hypothetical protein
MKKQHLERPSERGGATVKLLLIGTTLVLLANAGFNYVPIAYEGASFRQEMDTAVVKGLAASGQMKPMDVVKAHIQKAATDYEVPSDAVIEIKPAGNVIQAHVAYSKGVEMLPFGLYKYNYEFNHVATPVGYLTKQ